MDIDIVSHPDELPAAFEVFRHLRPHLDFKRFRAQVERQWAQSFRIAALRDAGHIVAVAGFRNAEFLAWGKVLYIDDLATLPGAMRKGHGGALLDWLVEQAKASGCDAVHLDTGYTRHDAHRMYLRKGFRLSCHHLQLDL